MNIKRFICYIVAAFMILSTTQGGEIAQVNVTEYRAKDKKNLDKAQAAYDSKDYKKAIKIAQKLAKRDIAEAQHMLGLCHEFGNGVEQSYTEAVKWYTLAAEQGDAPAQRCLGICYEHGTGIGES